jgi:hypothetical protein
MLKRLPVVAILSVLGKRERVAVLGGWKEDLVVFVSRVEEKNRERHGAEVAEMVQ